MPPRSLRSSSNATPQKRSTSSSTKPLATKRSRVTPTKSGYFKNNDPKEDAELSAASSATAGAEASGYEDEDAPLSEPSSDSEVDDEEYDSEESSRPKKKQKRGRPAPRKTTASATVLKTGKGQELWRQGVKTGLGPGTQVVIDKPKARSAGSTPYAENTIHPNTMLFLEELAENNDREWLKMHDPDYRTSQKDFNSFIECLQEKIISLDETIPELPIKDVTYFSAAWSRTGRKGPFAAYYVQIKPKGSFVGGGLWMPEAQRLAALRTDIDREPQKFKRILSDPKFRKQFFAGVGADEKKIVKAFVDQNTENALKTKPKGYDADHKDIALLRLRNWTIGRKLNDEEIIGKHGIARITELISCLVPFITHLNSVVMPDEPDQDDADEGDGSDGSSGDSR